ncbi:MAG: HPF/RaiA family ribosome-associated protein [Bacteroidia bacterium]
MIIQINTDKTINGDERHRDYFSSMIKEDLKRYEAHITRVEVHLKDENGPKDGVNDMTCVLEARLKSRQPIVVTNQADTVEQALTGAIEKINSSIGKVFGKLQDY